MSKVSVTNVKSQLDTHEAVCAERWKETILRIKRIEHIIETINGVRNERTIVTDLNSRLN